LSSVRLFNFWRSSSSYRVRIALNYKAIAYDYIAVNLTQGEQLSANYLLTHPLGHVPALELDGIVFVESIAILELLEERFPEPHLYPSRSDERAHVRALVELVNSGIQPLQNLVVLKTIGDAKKQAWLEQFLPRGLAAVEAQMAAHAASGVRGDFAFGATFSAADCALVPQVYSAIRFGIPLTPYPRIARAYAAALEIPAVAAAAPEVQPDAPHAT
jgi:maleylpyruvate isomerase